MGKGSWVETGTNVTQGLPWPGCPGALWHGSWGCLKAPVCPGAPYDLREGASPTVTLPALSIPPVEARGATITEL